MGGKHFMDEGSDLRMKLLLFFSFFFKGDLVLCLRRQKEYSY